MTTAPESAPGQPGAHEPLLTPTMVGIASGAILVPLNSTMLAVALPSVMATFAVPPDAAATLVTVYLGAVAVALPLSGSLGDRFGHRRTFLVGVAGFALASLLAAVAPVFGLLVMARVLQAASGALVSTASVALVRAAAPAARRGEAFGLFDMLVSTSAAVGPLVGGLIVGWFDWRAMFLLAAPIAIVAALAVGARPDPELAATGRTQRLPGRPVDGRGLGILAILLVATLLALRGGRDGPIGLVAALGLPFILVALVVVELRTPEPAVDPRLFRSRPFAAALAGVFASTVILHALLILIPLLVEVVQAGSPEETGLVLLGISALGAIAAPIGGRVSDRLGRRLPAVVGAAAAVVGLAALWQVAGVVPALGLGVLLAVVGAGMGLAGSPRQAAAFEAVEPERVGMAAGTYYTGRYLGGVLGASLAGAVLGGAVTVGGVGLGLGLLTLVGVALLVSSLFLPGRRA